MASAPERGRTTPGTTPGSFAPKTATAPGSTASLGADSSSGAAGWPESGIGPMAYGPSTDPATGPFADSLSLPHLVEEHDLLASPENVTWDGERNAADANAEFARLAMAAETRRRELDPDDKWSVCWFCRQAVHAPRSAGPVDHGARDGEKCGGSAFARA